MRRSLDYRNAREGTRGRPLSRRQLEILALVAAGMTNAEIGRRLHFSEDTIKTHLRDTFVKLDAKTRSHAVALGFRRGLLR